jgi:hypothetical protein
METRLAYQFIDEKQSKLKEESALNTTEEENIN